MSLISVSNLTFYYEGSSDFIFEDVSFQMDTDWRLGFVARNGRGKTTFLKLLMGKMEYRGKITSSEQFDYFPFAVEDSSLDTLNIIDMLYPENEFWRICRELTLLEVEADILYRPFSTLSCGEQTKVMLAVLFSMEHRFLLIDEPTNHLDSRARELLGKYLSGKSGFILVSHDRRLLDSCVDHVLSINKTNIEIQKGNFTSWQENKRRQDAYEQAEHERLKKDISRLKTAARQSGEWADEVERTKIGHKNAVKFETVKNIDTRAYLGEKSRRMQMRRKNLERRQEREIEEKSSLLKNLEEAEELKLFPLSYRSERLVRFDGTGIAYGEKEVLNGLNFEICRGDRIVLEGKNGCGKSSVIRLLLGRLDGKTPEGMRVTGDVIPGGGLKVSYVPQSTGFLSGSLRDYADRCGADLRLLIMLLRKLDLSRTQLDKKLEEYSEGQKKKVLIAASLATRANLYLWDEPLNYIDVFSRMQIEDLILKYKPTLLFVEHDREFTEKIATRRLELKQFREA